MPATGVPQQAHSGGADASQCHMVGDRVVPDQVKCFVSVSVHDGGHFQAYKEFSNLPEKCGRKASCDKDCCDGV